MEKNKKKSTYTCIKYRRRKVNVYEPTTDTTIKCTRRRRVLNHFFFFFFNIYATRASIFGTFYSSRCNVIHCISTPLNLLTSPAHFHRKNVHFHIASLSSYRPLDYDDDAATLPHRCNRRKRRKRITTHYGIYYFSPAVSNTRLFRESLRWR